MKKSSLIAAVVALAAVGGAVVYFMPKDDSSAKPEWNVAVVESELITTSVTATGTVEPVTQVDVGTQVSGILTNLYVDYNSVVKEGQIIAELDKSTLTLDLNANKNSLARAESELKYQKANYNRVKALHERELIADSEYEIALYNYETAQNDYEIAANSLERSKINLGYATIYSPIDGVVLSKSVEEGQTVASSFSTPTLFSIAADLKDMEVIADVDEADIGDVVEGQRVTFTVDAFPGSSFEGFVKEVRQEGIVESNVVTYEVVISAANPDLKLKPGMTASVEIYTLEADCESVVPAAALSFSPAALSGNSEGEQSGRPMGGGPMGEGQMGGGPMGGGPMGEGQMGGEQRRAARPEGAEMDSESRGRVWVKVGDKIEPRRIVIGVSNGINTEVSGNIAVGDTVVIGVKSMPRSMSMGSGAARSPFVQQRPGAGPR